MRFNKQARCRKKGVYEACRLRDNGKCHVFYRVRLLGLCNQLALHTCLISRQCAPHFTSPVCFAALLSSSVSLHVLTRVLLSISLSSLFRSLSLLFLFIFISFSLSFPSSSISGYSSPCSSTCLTGQFVLRYNCDDANYLQFIYLTRPRQVSLVSIVSKMCDLVITVEINVLHHFYTFLVTESTHVYLHRFSDKSGQSRENERFIRFRLISHISYLHSRKKYKQSI